MVDPFITMKNRSKLGSTNHSYEIYIKNGMRIKYNFASKTKTRLITGTYDIRGILKTGRIKDNKKMLEAMHINSGFWRW